jgi:fructose-1,6-bisphosphatase I
MSLNRGGIVTLDEFTIQELRNFPSATGQLSGLFREIGLAAKRINVEVNKAGLVDILGDAGQTNVQGEDVKKLDVFANNQIIKVLQHGVNCGGVGSEEDDDIIVFNDELSNQGKYVVLMDPLDGSGNIDTNISIGTIFSVYRRITPKGQPVQLADFLQPGNQQVAAGYIIYGSSTIMVYATKRGVNGFTLDPSIGEWCLSHPNIQTPEQGKIYSVNYGNLLHYSQGVQNYIHHCEAKINNPQGAYSMRYVGSMVADIHRNLIKGGIFMYPATTSKPSGKLRLLYECNPMAFITEVAGGQATNGQQRILDIIPTQLHQRSPMFIGSNAMMGELQTFL